MTDQFILCIDHKGEEQHFTASLLMQGYTHKFKVIVGETDVFFEPDEEGHYRVVKLPWQDEHDLLKIDKQLLGALQQKIEEILG